jgi:hypothetical protein
MDRNVFSVAIVCVSVTLLENENSNLYIGLLIFDQTYDERVNKPVIIIALLLFISSVWRFLLFISLVFIDVSSIVVVLCFFILSLRFCIWDGNRYIYAINHKITVTQTQLFF